MEDWQKKAEANERKRRAELKKKKAPKKTPVKKAAPKKEGGLFGMFKRRKAKLGDAVEASQKARK